jgi:DNA replication protein DnaC
MQQSLQQSLMFVPQRSADGSLRNLLARLARMDVLVVDDWAMNPLTETERRDFWEICEDRCQTLKDQ